MQWMEQNREVLTEWPVNEIYAHLREMLRASAFDHLNQAVLLDLLSRLTGKGFPVEPDTISFSTRLPLTTPPPDIHFSGRRFCLTGRFKYGTRRQCEEAILKQGGITERTPTSWTDYLVIGEIGSRDWIHSTHGRKIEAAVEMHDRGRRIAIVSEQHWIKFLKIAKGAISHGTWE